MTQSPLDSNIKAVPLLDVSRGNDPLREEILATVAEIIDSGRFVGGPHCQSLENAVARDCETEFAIGCASGSDAILLALMANDIGPGDEVICPSFTFFATASAITRLGATPVFIDLDPITFNMDVSLLESMITANTRAILPVHLFGQCCDMDSILGIAQQRRIVVIEDAAQAIGATFRGQPAGSMGNVGCFSFYPTKNLGGFGDGGMLTTNDPALADRLRLIANHGMRPRYHHQEIGINSRLDAIQAAVLSLKIRHLQSWTAARIRNAESYRRYILESGMGNQIELPLPPNDHSIHVWNQFTIRIANGWRDHVRQQLSDSNVGTEIYYPIPLHLQKSFEFLCYEHGSLPETEQAAGEVLSLPIFPELEEQEIRFVVDSLVAAMSSQTHFAKLAS